MSAETYNIDTEKFNKAFGLLENNFKAVSSDILIRGQVREQTRTNYEDTLQTAVEELVKVDKKLERKLTSERVTKIDFETISSKVGQKFLSTYNTETGNKAGGNAEESNSEVNTEKATAKTETKVSDNVVESSEVENKNLEKNESRAYNKNTDPTKINVGEVFSFVGNKVLSNNSSAENTETGIDTESIETQVAEVSDNSTVSEEVEYHSGDEGFIKMYSAYATRKAVKGESIEVNGKTVGVEEFTAEFERIYDIGYDDETPSYEVESDIFTEEQIREIYASGIADESRDSVNPISFAEALQEEIEQAKANNFTKSITDKSLNLTKSKLMNIADKLGIKVEFVDELSDIRASSEIDKSTGTVRILNSADNKLQLLFIHELTHYLEKAQGYSRFEQDIFESKTFKKWLGLPTPAKSYQSYSSVEEYRKVKRATYGEQSIGYINQEIIATFVSENLFQGSKGIENLIGESTGAKRQRIKNFLKKIIQHLRELFGSVGKLEREFKTLLKEIDGGKVTQENGKSKTKLFIEENTANEGVNDYARNSNTADMGRRKVSTVGENENSVRKSGNGAENVGRNLGNTNVFNGMRRQIKTLRSEWLVAGNSSISRNNNGQRKIGTNGLFESDVRKLSKIELKDTDTAGRKINNEIKKKFADTVFKSTEGKLLSLYHWTDKKFEKFELGDIGFHFGTYTAAQKRNEQMRNREKVGKGSYKEVYLNIKSPAIIEQDPMTWHAFSASYLLNRQGIITDEDISFLETKEGFKKAGYDLEANIALRQILKEKGYDGIIYNNGFESDYSVIAFYPEQIYTVEETQDEYSGSDFAVDENSKKDSESDIRYSIEDDIVDTNGNRYQKVVLVNQDIFKGVSSKNRRTVFKNFVSGLAGERISVFNSTGESKIIEFAKSNERVKKTNAPNGHKVLDKLAYKKDRNSQLAVVNSVELVEISLFSNENREHNHQWLDENGWEYRTSYMMTPDGKIYEVTLNIAKTRDGRNILYDINKIRQVGKASDSAKKQRGINSSLTDDSIVSYDTQNVNKKFSIPDRLPNGEFDKSGNFHGIDDSGNEINLTAKEVQQYLKAHPYEAIHDKRQIERKSNQILKAYGSLADKVEVAKELDDIYYRKKVGKEYRNKIKELAEKIYDYIVEDIDADSKEAYDEIRNYQKRL